MSTHTCEIAVIGGGAAGLSAALLLVRARRDVVVIDAGEPRNELSAHARGFLSRDGYTPLQILEEGREEFLSYGGRLFFTDVERLDPGRTLHLGDGTHLTAERVVLATGLRDVLPEIPGLAERWGRDVLHCPYCHAYDAGEVPFVVLGTHPNAVHHSLLLKQWSPAVTLAAHNLDLVYEQRAALSARGVDIVEGAVERIQVEDDAVSGVIVDGRHVDCRAVFLFPRPVTRDGFAKELSLERDPLGFPVTDDFGRSSVPWLYVAGNAADPRMQALTAAGDGSRVAFGLHNQWVQDEVADAVRNAL